MTGGQEEAPNSNLSRASCRFLGGWKSAREGGWWVSCYFALCLVLVEAVSSVVAMVFMEDLFSLAVVRLHFPGC